MASPDEEASVAMAAALEPFYKVSGQISSTYSMLEHYIDQSIWRVAELSPAVGACITIQLTSTSARIKALIALLQLREGSDDLLCRLRDLNGRMHPITDSRNRAIHDALSVSEDGNVAHLRISLDNKQNLTLGAVPISIDEFILILKGVGQKMLLFKQLHDDIISWLETSPQKWRAPLPGLFPELGGKAPTSANTAP